MSNEFVNKTITGLKSNLKSAKVKGERMTKSNKSYIKPDVIQKQYWRNKDAFADLFNSYLFHGKEIIKPVNLVENDTDNSMVVDIDGADFTFQGARDNIETSMTHEGVEYAILGIDDQNFINYAMPIQVGKYDMVAYLRQYLQLKKHYTDTNELSGNERMSGIKMTDKLTPVVTVVIYFGSKPWDGPKSLCEMLRLPDELKPYVNDFKLNLLEVRDNDLVFHNQDNNDLFSLLKIMYDVNADRQTKRQQLEQYSTQRKVDQTVVKVIASVTNVNMDIFEKEEEVTMCELWDEVRDEGRIEGRAEGRIEGRAEGEIKGEDRLAKLVNRLMSENRFDDVTKVTMDTAYRQELYAKYSITV
jgi:hypothetical protein